MERLDDLDDRALVLDDGWLDLHALGLERRPLPGV